jgi:hypothetical protein
VGTPPPGAQLESELISLTAGEVEPDRPGRGDGQIRARGKRQLGLDHPGARVVHRYRCSQGLAFKDPRVVDGDGRHQLRALGQHEADTREQHERRSEFGTSAHEPADETSADQPDQAPQPRVD